MCGNGGAQRIVDQLVEGGYITGHPHDGHGSRVTYKVDRTNHLRRPHLGDCTAADLLATFDP